MGSECVRGGHNFQCPGASAIIDETTDDRLVCASMIKYLKLAKERVVDGTPGRCSENTDLNFGTDTANNAKVDLFIPIHFNKAYDHYEGAIGSEVWINPKNATSVAAGTRIVNALASLGFKNRGLKDGVNGEHLHDIRASNMPAVLVEVCFVEATADVRIYRANGPDKIGKVIAEAILGHKIDVVPTPNVTPVAPPKVIPVPDTRVNNSVAQLQTILNAQGAHLLVDGFYGPKTLAACPVLKQGSRGDLVKWLQKRLAIKLQDGIFGTGTSAAVQKYQVALHLASDGIVGQGTWSALLK